MRAVFVRGPSRIGSGVGDVTSAITDAATASMMPAIQQIIVNDIMPYMGVAIVVGAISAAFVGTWFGVRAVRAHGGIRNNPVSRTSIRLRRRRT